jgi:sulfur carrier protein ThiS
MRLHLGGFFSFYIPQRPQWVEIELPEPRLLSEVLEELGIPAAEVSLTVVNQELVELNDAIVTNEDEVRLYPPIGGGYSLTDADLSS